MMNEKRPDPKRTSAAAKRPADGRPIGRRVRRTIIIVSTLPAVASRAPTLSCETGLPSSSKRAVKATGAPSSVQRGMGANGDGSALEEWHEEYAPFVRRDRYGPMGVRVTW